MKKYPWRYGWFIMAYYTANAVYQGYMSKYYQSRGVTNAQLSVLMAAVPLVSILMQPVWGSLGDRAKTRNGVLRLLVALSAGLVLLFLVSDAFAFMLVLACVFAACYTSIQPMGDSIVLEQLDAQSQPFGPLRLTGCLSFAVFNLFFGYWMGERFQMVLFWTCGLLALLFAATYSLPPVAGHQSRGRKMNMAALLKQKELMKLLGLLGLLQLTMGYFYSFFSVHFTSLEGGTTTLLGVAYFLSATSEVAFLLNADRLFDRFGAGKLMLLSALCLTARWTILGFTDNAYVALVSQLLHGGGFIVMTVTTSKYVSRTVPDELKASGQMLLSVVGFGVARAFGILGGGFLSDALGSTQRSFLVMACVAFAALLTYAPVYLKKPPLNGR